MYELKFVTPVLITIMFVSNIITTQDVNLSMFMYLANHLTPQECIKLTSYLYAEGLEPTAAKELGKQSRASIRGGGKGGHVPLAFPCLLYMYT